MTQFHGYPSALLASPISLLLRALTSTQPGELPGDFGLELPLLDPLTAHTGLDTFTPVRL